MELIRLQVDGDLLLIRGLHALGMRVSVQHATDLEARRGSRGRDETDAGRMGEQRLAAPVLRDEREETMLDLVPLAGTRRAMAGRNHQSRLLGQLLELDRFFPQPLGSRAI